MGKMRSPNYPALGLTKAIEMARKVWDKEKRTPVQDAVIVKALGFEGLSGPARTALSALRKFGLLDKNERGFQLSGLAMKLIHHKEHSPEYNQAITEAATLPPLFADLYATHSDASDEAIKTHLVLKLGFSDAGAKTFINAFRDTLPLVKQFGLGYNAEQEPNTMPTNREEISAGGSKPGYAFKGPQVISVPISQDITAEIRFTGGPATSTNLKILQKYLDIATKVLEESLVEKNKDS